MTAKASRKRGRKRGDTRERVVKSAARLFATHGYSATSIAAICEASGVLTSSIYWEFGSKAGILAAVLEDSAQRWLDYTTKSVVEAVRQHPASTGADRLAAYFDYMADALTKGPEFLRLMLMVALERRHADPRALEIIRSHRTRSIATLSRLFMQFGIESAGPDGLSAHDLAALTIACFDGGFISAQIDAETAQLHSMFNVLHRALLAVLRSQSEPVAPSE